MVKSQETNSSKNKTHNVKYFNRELSWLAFNDRVLRTLRGNPECGNQATAEIRARLCFYSSQIEAERNQTL